ncbi:TIGR03943 family protein [Verrucomicrobium sp. GAS474]|uniref:TIGR03943 family putative permease subunit n=1 Tax=Verrucomicrobium sp. GAS474 TaxID=1882831 RepID=UPI00087ABA7D|nr:hypothetical protein [Verrucomicrobium sp. GAS474]SDT96622.1 TIGR03943 family protein [Verrucomicrobium sp. GAS474]
MAPLLIFLRRMFLPLVLGTLGTGLLHAWLSGQVTTLLHPLLHPLVAGGGIVLLLAAFLFLLFPLPPRPWWKSGRDALLAAALVLALAAAPGSFSSLALANRASADPGAVLRGKAEADDEPFAWKPDSTGAIPLEVTDLFMAVGLPKSVAALEGKKVRLIGQATPGAGSGQSDGSFRLVRFLMFCCAADAQPLAMSVRGAEPEGLANMGWAEAVGTVHYEDSKVTPGKQEPVLLLETAKAIPEPKERFLY